MTVLVCVGVGAAFVAAVVVYALMRGAIAAARAEARATDRSVEGLRAEFASLAAATLEGKAKSLAEQNAAQVRPLFEQLTTRFGELLKAQSLGRQADEFVAALKGGNKSQGNWGEGIVRNVLESAGLRPGTDFIEQQGANDALPDFTVLDGVHRKILIDSKVNIDAFLAADEAERENRPEDAAKCRAEHAKRVRAQIVNLSDKKYPERLKSHDADAEAEYSPVVIMAMPSEATYSAAISADPQLVAFANERAVVLASPQMLFGYLVLFKIGMDRLKVDRNNQEIANRARQLLERMDAAFAALEKVGKSLGVAQDQYHEAMRKLGGEEGGQNILAPARALAKFATTTRKCASLAMQQPQE